jgi:monoamine oxidase
MCKLSIKGFSDICKRWQAGDENYMINKLSHTDIISKIYNDIIDSIQYNKEIKKVLYDDDKVTLIDNNNSIYTCDICVITVPVTQIKKITFQPVFSKERTEAFNKIHLDNVAKLVLKFKKQFWADNCSWLLIPGSINVYWPVTQGMKTNESILTGMVSGKQSQELNKLYQEDKQKFINIILNDIEKYCKCNVKDDLIDFYWFDWKSVPFIEGGYSFPSVEEGNSRDIIREPLQNKLFFAGEAYARYGHIGTIHGAIETAHEASKLIINLL